MSSYIPPHRRNARGVAPAPPKQEDTSLAPSNFPQLAPVASSSARSVPWTASKLTFEEKPRQIPMFTSSISADTNIARPSPFFNRYRSSAVDYEEEPEEEEMGPTGPTEEEWTTVTRKVRRKKTLIEKHEEELKEEEERKENEEKKDTVWNDVNEYETYWDERRY